MAKLNGKPARLMSETALRMSERRTYRSAMLPPSRVMRRVAPRLKCCRVRSTAITARTPSARVLKSGTSLESALAAMLSASL